MAGTLPARTRAKGLSGLDRMDRNGNFEPNPPPRAGWLRALVILAAFPALVAAPPAFAGTGEPPGDGAALYRRVCSACHGEKGDGCSLAAGALATPPRDFTSGEARLVLSREYMIAIVRDGRPHTPMVARSRRLTQREAEGVVDYIRSAFMAPGPEAAASPRAPRGRPASPARACGR